MESLYSTLFEHWRGNDREALEPFLTRAIADLLQRIGKHNIDCVKKLIFSILLNPVRRTSGTLANENFKTLATAINTSEKLEWVAELPITVSGAQRYIDLCLFLNGCPALVLENKVTADFTEDQLPAYGNWIAKSAKTNRGALVLLSYATLPPKDFLSAESDVYVIPLRSVCSWLQIHEWLRQVSVADRMTAGLVSEFCDFMEAQNVSGMTNRDAEILEALLSHGTHVRINSLFVALREQFAPQLKLWAYRFDRRVDAWAYGQGDTVWDWCYFRGTMWYISWGLTANTKKFFKDPVREGSLTCFIRIGSDKGDIPVRDLPLQFWSSVSAAWTKSPQGNQCWITEDAISLFSQPQGFMQAFAEWLQRPIADANKILNTIDSQRVSSQPSETPPCTDASQSP